MRLAELAARLEAELVGNSAEGVEGIEITGVAAASTGTAQQVVFAESEPALARALASHAAAVLTSSTQASSTQGRDVGSKPLLLVQHPRLAFARAARLLAAGDAGRPDRQVEVHPSAVISPSAILDGGVGIGPGVVIEREACIGGGSRIGAGVVIGAGVRIGSDCRLHPRVVLYPGTILGERVIVHAGAVLGADGFGYVHDPASGEYIQFPQQGRLVIEDDVEIGANATIDRGALEETRIARGTKLDNLVHVGHNVSIGRNVVIAAQTGVSGSSTIGDGAIIGGQVGIGDHVEIGAGAILGGQAGIASGKRIRGEGIVFWGTPARPIKEYLKELATLARLTRRAR
jgi:UDP-3-O-[3-hydroxymyristoyl] glucosamine N-acyltransferase